MDATALLALAAKVNKVFHEEESFLSVPLGLPSYSPEQFAAIPHAPESASQLLQLSEFSRLVNLKPDGAVWRTLPSNPLWTIVSDIFKNAVVARKRDVAEGQSQYDEALSVLRRKNDKGSYAVSEKLRTYRQYEDAWRVLIQRHRAAEANERDQHHLLGIRSELESLNVDWLDKGFKEEVEDALRSLHSSSPRRIRDIWDDWSLRLMDSVDKLTDVHGNRFIPTVYSPSNVVESPAWVTIEIGEDELQSLVAEAEPELATVLNVGDSSEAPILGIKFQATSVSIVRSWLPHDLFSSRFWRFKDPNRMIDWGGYVTGLVLIRNLQVFTEPTVETPDPIVDPEVFVGEEQGAEVPLDPEAARRKVRDKRVAIGVLVFAFIYTAYLSISAGAPRFLPIWAISGVTIGMIYYLFVVFRASIHHKRFETSKTGKIVRWTVFVFLILLFSKSLIYLNHMYPYLVAGGGMDACIDPIVDSAEGIGEEIGALLIGLLFCAFANIFAQLGVIILPVIVGLMLLSYWLTTRFRPMRRATRYFKEKLADSNYARLTPGDSGDEASLEALEEPPIPPAVDDYPDRVFIAAFVSRRLGRVPNPDESLQW